MPKEFPIFIAKKEEHKVHLGWYHFDEGNKNKNACAYESNSGRGKRTAMLNKALSKQYIIKECLNIVSTDGESQHGELKEMDVKLKDFHLKPLEDKETTLGDMIDKAKLKFVYVYLRTRQKKQLSDDEGLE